MTDNNKNNDAKEESGNTTENKPLKEKSPQQDEQSPTADEQSPTAKEQDNDEHREKRAGEKEKKNTDQKAPHAREGGTKAPESENHQNEEEGDEDEKEGEFYGIPVRAYDEMNIDALAEELERLLKAHKVKEIRHHAQEIKMEFDAKFGKERKQKKEAFLNDGGNIIDFSYSTPAERKFNKIYFTYKENRDNYYKKVRKNLQENLEQRLAIIEELKAITGVGTDMNANFKTFKKLQDRWKKAGQVPRNDYKDTWKTYHHYVERFYDFLHLDREFREMDYRHNLEQKLKMIDRAEELAHDSDINRAFRELQNLHRMWKEEVGPVAKEYREDIWEKFSAATKHIHENRKAYLEQREQEKEKNRAIKSEIIANIEELKKEEIHSHGQAQKKIKKHQHLRDKFFKTGKVPRKHNQEIWEAFKKASREFNHKKNEFYRKRKQEQKDNLKAKLELIKIAEEHQYSDDFKNITPLMKKIQGEWKKIGYVPRSKSNKIWKRFKKACNHYFDRLHARQDDKEKAALEIYDKKAAMLEELKTLTLSEDRDEALSKIKEKVKIWKSLGGVPKHKKKIESKFNETLDKLLNRLNIGRKEAEMLKYENHLQRLKETDDEDKVGKEAAFLHKKITQTEAEIRQLETNLQFFDNADKDNPIMKDTFEKMDRLKQELKIWKAKFTQVKAL